jgi:hypothetical protein
MLRRGWLYTVCGRTGAGKSGFGVLLTLLIAAGGMLAGRQCQAGPVLYIAAENPDDVRHRFIVAIEVMGLSEEVIDRIQIIDRNFLLQERMADLMRIIEAMGAAVIIVDTDQAVSLVSGASENDNVERITHARRLRRLSQATSRPTVIDLCHPAGNADNLVPRGGSSFLNEINGNIRISRNNAVVTIKTDPEKYRGEQYEFTLRSTLHRSERVRDAKGRIIPIPIMEVVVNAEPSLASRDPDTPQVEADADMLHARMLVHQKQNESISNRDFAKNAQWLSGNGKPDDARVTRAWKRLEARGLARKDPVHGWVAIERS